MTSKAACGASWRRRRRADRTIAIKAFLVRAALIAALAVPAYGLVHQFLETLVAFAR